MTLYPRPDEHVFAEGARPGEVQPFPDLSRGWGIAFEQTGGIPPMEWFNFIGKRADEAIRYLMQRGLPEWSETEDYPEGSYTQYAGKTYRAKVENKGKVPSTSLAEWEEWGLTRAALDQSFHPKNGELAWPHITQTPTTLNGYGITDAAPIADPAFIGEPTAPTPDDEDNSQRVSTTAFVHKKLAAVAPTGAIMFFASQTAPDGWLKANGATIDNALYQELDAVIYVGDADNATASFGYRCTDKDNPDNTRSTYGNFTVLPDLRGYFLRGLDMGADRDSGRTLGSVQDSQNKAHAHAASASTEGNHVHSARTDIQGNHNHHVNDPGHDHIATTYDFEGGAKGFSRHCSAGGPHDGFARTNRSGTGIRLNEAGNHSHNVAIGDAGSHSHAITVNGDGGEEARPINIALLVCIKH